MTKELVIIFAAVIVAWLVFTWVLKVLKASLGTAIALAIIVLILQLFFGIGFQEFWQQIVQIAGNVWQFFTD